MCGRSYRTFTHGSVADGAPIRLRLVSAYPLTSSAPEQDFDEQCNG
jgi:hypothetical protein